MYLSTMAVFHMPHSCAYTYIYTIYIIIIYMYMQVVEEKYSQEKQVSIGPEQLIQFEAAEIKLDIPKDGTTLKEGWKILPLIAPVVRVIDQGCISDFFQEGGGGGGCMAKWLF